MIEDLGEGGEDGMEDSIARIMGLDKQRATPEDAEIITAQAQARRNLEERQQQLGAGDYVADVAMAVPRGVVGAAQGVYNLADILTFDILPDWDKNPLGGSATTVGGIVETIAEFGVGFLTGSAAISAASKIGKLGKVAKAAKWMQGPGKLQSFSKAATAGAIADFSVFEGDSMRLSNLVESIPGLSNPITEFLSAKEGDVDSLANRLKNVIEGGVVGSAVEGGIRGINGAYRMARGIAAAADVVRETRLAVEANKPLDEVFAVREAAMERNRKWIEDVPAASEEYVAAAERRFVEQDGAAQVLREQQPGSEKMIQRILLDSARKAEGGGLPRTAARAIESFIDRVGSLLFDGTTFSVRKLGEGHAGKYEFASDIITIARKVYEDAVDADKTFLHEAWHMLSRYLDDPVVRRLKTDYDKSVEAFRKKAGFDPRSMYAGDGNVDKLAKASKDAGADFFEAYAMTNMDEWFVYNMVKQTEKTMAREARTGAFGAVRNVIDSLVDSFRADGEMSKIADKFLSGGMENKAHRNLMTSYRRRLRERTAYPTSADDLKVRSRREVDAGMASEDSVDMIRPVPTNADGTPNVSQLEADLKGTDAVAYSDKTPPTMTQAEQRLDPRVAAVRGSLEQLESLDEVAGLAAKDIDVAGLALDDELRRRMWVASEEVIRISRLPAYADQEIDVAAALELLTERGQAYRESGTPVARRLQARDVYKDQYEEQLSAVSGGGTLPPDPPLLPNQTPAATQASPTSPAAPSAPAASAAPTTPSTPAAPAAAGGTGTGASTGGTGTGASTGGTGTGASTGGTGRPRAAARRARIKQTQMVNVGGRQVPLSHITSAINQRGGQRLLSLIMSSAAMTPHVPVSSISRFLRMGLDMFTEMFKASILSGPRTLSTNHLGSMIAAMVTQTERAIGARIASRTIGGRVSRVLAQREGRVLMGHMNLATDTVRLLSFGAMDLPASVRNTFRQGGTPTLIPDSIISEASPGAFSPARTGLRTVKRDAQGNPMFDALGRIDYEATGLGAALDWIGKVVGLPFRLMGTSDEMTKFRVIRENLTGILTDDVVKRNPGATADQIQQIVEAEFDKMLVDQKRLYSLAAVQEKAMRQAARLPPPASPAGGRRPSPRSGRSPPPPTPAGTCAPSPTPPSSAGC